MRLRAKHLFLLRTMVELTPNRLASFVTAHSPFKAAIATLALSHG
ncbi:hypothetical protein RD1_0576 [Roseobacter denitrificans OCh 114]|uniref:Uncharacterized protein n=1 Tax=Roseobacter denitrificans (strain ATCC 33942 / OCh 114) TaxID=375451 RepID=Q16CL3_ROSDO|nr:hypothetical protein RD1_0576 [Roseobacter denitrificans OCh 114]